MANHKKTQKPRKSRRPLPKVGTPADDAYRLEHSRRDVVDFGLASPKRAKVLSWVIFGGAAALLLVGTIALIIFT